MNFRRSVFVLLLTLILFGREVEPVLVKALCEPFSFSHWVDHAE